MTAVCPRPKQWAAVPPDVTLVYWDYYHETEQEYTDMLQKHAALPAPTVFAGGIWTWCGLRRITPKRWLRPSQR